MSVARKLSGFGRRVRALRADARMRIGDGMAFGSHAAAWSALVLAAACATKQPAAAPAPMPAQPAAAPAPASAAPPAASATPPEPAAPPAPAAAATESEPPASPSAENESAHHQTPIAILTARDVAFLVDYANSGARENAETECAKEDKGDPALHGACLEKARDKFQPDVLRFTKDEQNHFGLVVYKRFGSTLKELYVGSISFSDESENSVHIKFSGREKGQRPIFRSRSDAVIEVPNDYSIEVEDPPFGKLGYSAKIGLVAPQ